MYETFQVETESNRNKKVDLLTEAIRISLEKG